MSFWWSKVIMIESHIQVENLQHQSGARLLELVCGNDSLSGLIVELLNKAELLVLLRTSMQIRTSLLRSRRAINKIYYECSLQWDKSAAFSVYYEDTVRRREHEKLTALYEHERLDWAQQLKKLNWGFGKLEATLQPLTPETAHQITVDVGRALREPDMPIPHLRHESVGTFCNSTFQVLLAELNWAGRATSDQWQLETYLPLKKTLLQQADSLRWQLQGLEPTFLKTLRYCPQTLESYQRTPSCLANIIQLLLLSVRRHLDGLVSYFLALCETTPGTLTSSISTDCSGSLADKEATEPVLNPDSPFEFLLEFVGRYRQFRNTVSDLEERIGFVFEHFGMMFECLYPQYSLHPSFHLWRCLQKMWVSKMKRFHAAANVAYCQLLLSQVQSNTQRLFTECCQDDPIFNNQAHLCYLKQKPLSQRYSQRMFGKPPRKSCYNEPECQGQLFREYTEYLVDVSINEYNVHWCGSTRQRLGLEFRRAEKAVVAVAGEYLHDVFDGLGSVLIAKVIFQSMLEFLQETLKPPTLNRIIQDGLEFLGEVRQRKLGTDTMVDETELAMLREWKLRLPDLGKNDLTVEYFSQDRKIAQETGEEYAMFFDMDKQVSLEMLENMADGSDLGSEPQAFLQSYVSNDSNDHLDLQEPPKLTLGRINSTM